MFYLLNTFLSSDSVILLNILHRQLKLNQLQADRSLPSLQPFLLILIPFFGWVVPWRENCGSRLGQEIIHYNFTTYLVLKLKASSCLSIQSPPSSSPTEWEALSISCRDYCVQTILFLPSTTLMSSLHPSNLPAFMLTRLPLWEYDHTVLLFKITPLIKFLSLMKNKNSIP